MATYATETTYEITRDQDGNITKSQKHEVSRVLFRNRGQHYVNVMVNGASSLLKLNASELKVILLLAMRMDIDGNNRVDISTSTRKSICKSVGISPKTLRNILHSLRTKGLLLPDDASLEWVNPAVLYRGKIADSGKAALNYQLKCDKKRAGDFNTPSL